MNIHGWQFWIDRGGTFTDVVALAPDGEVIVRKLLSVNPAVYPDAALHAISDILAATSQGGAQHQCTVKMGTTLGTNALLERKGEPTVLVTNKGFADALRIGYQNRPDIFALEIILPEMLYSRVMEVGARVDADGNILAELDETQVERELRSAFESGFRSCAVLLLHGYKFPEHEKRIAAIALKCGFENVSCSHLVSPLIKFVSRGDTALCDAYLSPLLRRYTKQIRSGLPDTTLMFMQSNGGLTNAESFSGKDSLLSGPAGGLIGAIKIAGRHGLDRLVSFDMGGTSTDVSHFSGELEYSFETQLAGIRLRSPILDIHTVAAGGGSILQFDGTRMRVGPASAGALPGPMCYRNGGPLTVSDANVMLGKIQPDLFPQIFGPQQNLSLDKASVSSAFLNLSEEVHKALGVRLSPESLADGFVKIAITKMANAIKKVSVQRGHDVSSYALVCFGGAGGQHACLLAASLGITKILIHPLAGVLSALGIGLADVIEAAQFTVNAQLEAASMAQLVTRTQQTIKDLLQRLHEQKLEVTATESDVKVLLRYENCDFSLPVNLATVDDMSEEFATRHLERYGFVDPNRRVLIDSVAAKVYGKTIANELKPESLTRTSTGLSASCDGHRSFFSNGEWHQAPIIFRADLTEGMFVEGPAIIVEATATTILEPGWQCTVLNDGSLLLTSSINPEKSEPVNAAADVPSVDPVKLELFNNLFMFIAEEMGVTLQNTSYSVNIKERLDFSCAIFDHAGNLIANAPHIPVHLGSMGESVKNLLFHCAASLRPGDVYATNDPYNGGTHLPDITVITPIFDEQGELQLFCASRGHHADIGGVTPGSMPPQSAVIEEEGVLLTNLKIVSAGEFLESEVLAAFQNHKYPARNPAQNLADLKAQIAANARGASELNKAIKLWGLSTVKFYMDAILSNAEECVRKTIEKLASGSAVSELDDGSTIAVKVTVNKEDRSATVDFSGTSSQHAGNLNAPLAVTYAAVLYVFRTLVRDDIPLNAGCLRPLQILVPKGSMLNPREPAAVVAGNVETSQQIVDALYAALGVMACSQGTMNNFTFGNQHFQYYETIAGGTGAGGTFDGADAVQSHMTNSRLTDPEVLESRFPVLLEEFSIRRNSGGAGNHRGGDGVVRKILFKETMIASILSDRRRVAPAGLNGGAAGKTGNNYVLRASGVKERLGNRASVSLDAGDLFVIETPGGGGFEKTQT